MRRAAGLLLIVLAACGGSSPAPPTTGPTTASTSAATTAPTTAPTTTGPTTAATSGGGIAAACVALDTLQDAISAAIPDYDQISAAGNDLIQVSGTLPDEGQATLLAAIGQDAADSAQAFLDGDFQKGADLKNMVLDTIPPAKVALSCR